MSSLEESQNQAQHNVEEQQQLQEQDWQLSVTPCSYIPTQIFSGLAASITDNGENQNAMRSGPMDAVPPTFEV